MSRSHVVQQGQHLALIARAHGYTNWDTIWNAPENKDLKDLRKNPDVLYPGDVLHIPEKEARHEQCATERRHKFIAKVRPLHLRIVLSDPANQPLAGHDCTLFVENDSEQIPTPGDGLLEKKIPINAASGKLVDRGPTSEGTPGTDRPRSERVVGFRIGHLDPVTELSGQIARLNNLGYNAGTIPDHTITPDEEKNIRQSVQFRSAVEEFQCDAMGNNDAAKIKQVVDGICGKNTQAKLLERHGS